MKNYGPEALHPQTDNRPIQSEHVPEDFSDFILPLATDPQIKNVIHVKKHNWGAFFGTDLDVQLRRRGIDTILLSGIATTIGVDTTAREAYQLGYQVITIEDAMTDFNGQLHQDIVEHIFKRLGKVWTSDQVIASLN